MSHASFNKLIFCEKKIFYDLLSGISISTTLYGGLEINNILNISDGVKLTLCVSQLAVSDSTFRFI